MRSTNEVITAVHNGEPCTEEELRLCILSMRSTVVMVKSDLARWAVEPIKPVHVKLKADLYWREMNNLSWAAPLDKRIPPNDRPGHPEFEQRRAVANKVMDKVLAGLGKK